ncbi:MAG TPA: glycoside hydrolase family 16 protein [Catenuloplanes sp.]
MTSGRIVMVCAAISSLLVVSGFDASVRVVPVVAAEEAVVSGSAADLSAWQAASAGGPVELAQAAVQDGPPGATSAADVRRAAGSGPWSQVLAALRSPETFFTVGRTYRMRAYVRDLNATGEPIAILLANRHYQHRPSEARESAGYRDTGWHLLTRTFVCTATGSADTSLYFELPGSGPLHWQITGASLQEVTMPGPATTPGAPTRVVSFAGAAGAAPDPTQWNHDVGAGWGLGELQRYTADPASAQLDGAGNLVITARRERRAGAEGRYTSARLTTRDKVLVPPGSYLEAPITMPVGAGVWPAFWLLGDDIGEVGWPACGEMDVVEVVGSNPAVALSATHQAAAGDPTRDLQYGWEEPGGTVDLGEPLDSATHTYGVYFDVNAVRLYIDRREHMTITAADALASGRTWPFGTSFFIVLNVAVGGVEEPDPAVFPRSMTVGAISIWQGGTPF